MSAFARLEEPIGGLPETAYAQLEEFRIMAADLEQKREKLEAELSQHLAEADDSPVDIWLHKEYEHLKELWASARATCRAGKATDCRLT
jgi:D-ribose pyranose/furanose isomerase RbsD